MFLTAELKTEENPAASRTDSWVWRHTVSMISDTESYTVDVNTAWYQIMKKITVLRIFIFTLFCILSLFSVASLTGCSTKCFSCILARFIFGQTLKCSRQQPPNMLFWTTLEKNSGLFKNTQHITKQEESSLLLIILKSQLSGVGVGQIHTLRRSCASKTEVGPESSWDKLFIYSKWHLSIKVEPPQTTKVASLVLGWPSLELWLHLQDNILQCSSDCFYRSRTEADSAVPGYLQVLKSLKKHWMWFPQKKTP